MTFEHPWVLLLLVLPVYWGMIEFPRTDRRWAFALKLLSLAAILLAIAEPVLTVYQTKVAIAVLVDTSQSLSSDDLNRASQITQELQRARGRHWMQVVPFARTTRDAEPAENARSWSFRYTSGDAGRGTDIEAGIREALTILPSGLVPRLALISDGIENRGSVVRAAWQAQQLGIPVDTFSLAGRPRPKLRLESASAPAQAFSGERFAIELTVTSPQSASANLAVSAEGKNLGTSQLTLQPGVNHVRAQASVTSSGSIDVSGTLSAPGLGEVRFDQAVNLRRPQLLLVSQDPPGTGIHLQRVLEQSDFDVHYSETEDVADLSPFQTVVLNNRDLNSISERAQTRLEQFVKEGGGLLVIGGEKNVYVEKQGPESPVERTLPAKLAPPRTPHGTCVVLIIDKSSSMEGKKMELARLAAIGVIENLRPIDEIGILIFDNSFSWTVPIRKAQNRSLVKRLVAGITPDGGTQIAPALAEAYHKIEPVNAVFKHIVLLTDGISEEGDSISLSREAGANRVTISTVGLGQDVNRAYLEKVAATSGGKSYFLKEPSGLEQILLKDVMEHTGSTAIERPIKAEVVKEAEILEDVGMQSAPPLAGYVKFTAKPTADTILAVERRDPLFVRWQYGLGRAAVFTSDAKSRWASQWVSWSGFDRFWANVVRDLLPHAEAGEAKVEYDSANDELVVDYRLGRSVEEPRTLPDIFVFGPDAFQQPVAIAKLAEGAFRGHVSIGDRRGFFRIRPLEESRTFPEVGFYRQEEELTDFGSNEFLLRQIAEFTGGRFNPAPSQIFDSAGRSIPATFRLWPALLTLALMLNLIELFLRKWPGVWQFLLRRRT